MTFLYIVSGILILTLLLIVCNRWLPKVFCTKVGWHLAPLVRGFDGASNNGTCPRCGKHVLQDSQIQWTLDISLLKEFGIDTESLTKKNC